MCLALLHMRDVQWVGYWTQGVSRAILGLIILKYKRAFADCLCAKSVVLAAK
jgi:hypothetical protein